MGARESRARNEEAGEQAGPPDYYALLEVEESATADEIRVRMSVLCHILSLLTIMSCVRRNRSGGLPSFTIQTKIMRISKVPRNALPRFNKPTRYESRLPNVLTLLTLE